MSQWIRELLLGVIAALVLSTAVVQGQEKERSFAMGLSYWPAIEPGTPSEVTKSRLLPISQNSDVVQVLIPWCPDKASEDFGWLNTVAEETDRLGIGIDWLGDGRNGVRCRQEQPWSFKDSTTAQQFTNLAVKFVERYQPEYVILGVEVDYYAVASGEDFPHFVNTYVRTRDTLKAIAPKTLVGVSLQYAHSNLLPGSSSTLLADMLAIFGDVSDFVGVSVYPFQLGFKPEDIDAEYFTPLRDLDLPLAIIETGWPGSDSTQRQYVAQLMKASNEVGARLVVWTAAVDVPPDVLRSDVPTWAAEIGLWNLGEKPKPSAAVWQSWLARSWSAGWP